MDTHDALTDDLPDEAAYRERATVLLDELAHQARVALRSADIPLNVYFIVPPSGDAILTLGETVTKEDSHDIKLVVSSTVQRSIGLEPSQCRQIICAMADTGDDAI